jgi:hypothetical protein
MITEHAKKVKEINGIIREESRRQETEDRRQKNGKGRKTGIMEQS